MDWEMIMVCWENMLPFIITGQGFRQSMKVCWILKQKMAVPTGAYIPRFRNVRKQETDFLRGYAATFSADR